ncbi:DUF6957 family protein [Pseudomonas sp. OTU5201]|uniref:DUF6957 family protein n=1 Tax=Pseudomonas sp. OTU5201 TaxID=3043850 RepID=UPI00313E6D20
MDIVEFLSKIAEVFYGKGESLPGCALTEAEAIAWVQQQFPHKPYCLVRDWRWLDLQLDGAALEEVERSGRRPALIFAETIVFDSRARFRPGHWVRTTLLVSYTEGGLFETRNTVYVLLGAGCRLSADSTIVASLFQ